MKKILLSIFALLSAFPLISCSARENNENGNAQASASDSHFSSSFKEGENPTQKAMVIYFSATNHTKAVAETVANHIHSAIYELVPTNPYSSADLNYGNQNSRVVQEYRTTQRGERVNAKLKETDFEGFDEAKYIFLGAPVWWQQLSWVVEDFVSNNDFSNKTIIPFGTSASSGFNLNNLTSLTQDDENVTWLAPQRFSSNVSDTMVINWVDSLKLNLK